MEEINFGIDLMIGEMDYIRYSLLVLQNIEMLKEEDKYRKRKQSSTGQRLEQGTSLQGAKNGWNEVFRESAVDVPCEAHH